MTQEKDLKALCSIYVKESGVFLRASVSRMTSILPCCGHSSSQQTPGYECVDNLGDYNG